MLWGELVQKQQEQRSIEAYPSTSMSMLQHADRRLLNEKVSDSDHDNTIRANEFRQGS